MRPLVEVARVPAVPCVRRSPGVQLGPAVDSGEQQRQHVRERGVQATCRGERAGRGVPVRLWPPEHAARQHHRSTCRVEGNRLGGDAQRRHHSLTEQLDPRPTRAQLDHTGEHGIAEVGIPHVHVASARLLDEPAELGQDLAVDAIGGPGSVRVADSMGLRREDARQPGGVLDERAHGDRRRRGPAGKQSPADRASIWAVGRGLPVA